MGYTMRSDRYRYTRWQQKNNPAEVVAVELYGLEKDPKELVNIAGKLKNKEVMNQLQVTMQQENIGTNRISEMKIN